MFCIHLRGGGFDRKLSSETSCISASNLGDTGDSQLVVQS